MSSKEIFILTVDQSTSGTKAIVFNQDGELITKTTIPLQSYYPQVGYVEQSPIEIYQTVIEAVKTCTEQFEALYPNQTHNIVSCGITNQRETFVVWDENGEPLHQAIVWQCKRSIETCNRLHLQGLECEIKSRTGLKIDPYFSATKLIHLYENDACVREKIEAGNAYFGTVDTWLLYKLTNGGKYITDHTNACRTLFYNIFELKWDEFLLDKFNLSKLNLPEVCHSSCHFGVSDFEKIFDRPIPITGMIGDSHAAAFGEACYSEGTAKVTLGTGSSILWNTGNKPVSSNSGMVTTICWSIENRINYALEGVIVSCGATIEWLKKQLGILTDSIETESIAQSLESCEGVYIIPAFSGMGAPHWKMNWKASIHGLTFKSNKSHIVRAALESIPYQIKDVISVMEQEAQTSLKELKADGGITQNGFLMHFLTDLLGTKVVNIGITDVSAYGAALIAGLGAGIWQNIEDFPKNNKAQVFIPSEDTDSIKEAYVGWQKVISDVLV
ncbi:FGGY family carbohydrate kinase [Chondrinema litorale]|uniref:FGGY family carbohydrate kinase n=1 Tax=Chondrinema litorale TaxID=2994555 RepID=UPI002542D451|nr:glycerol kinase GlpK [Chondrinema litorale]UZR98448.1 glycerol kinase GlpK [Chondrinema litorale]